MILSGYWLDCGLLTIGQGVAALRNSVEVAVYGNTATFYTSESIMMSLL